VAAPQAASKMLLGSLRPSSLPSARTLRQVEGMICIGPTARS
jgi:hypothetical protein